MRSHILQCKDQWLPFHIPTAAIREKPHQKLAKALHNHFQWEETVTPVSDASKLPCSCKEFPSITRHGEHIAASLSEFGKYIPSVSSFALSISGNSGFYSSKTVYFKQFTAALTSWKSHHGASDIFGHDVSVFLSAQWESHLEHLGKQETLYAKHVQAIKAVLDKKCVMHCEDHESNHIMVYCPCKYFQTTSKTWDDPGTFKILPFSPLECKVQLPELIPAWVVKSSHGV